MATCVQNRVQRKHERLVEYYISSKNYYPYFDFNTEFILPAFRDPYRDRIYVSLTKKSHVQVQVRSCFHSIQNVHIFMYLLNSMIHELNL